MDFPTVIDNTMRASFVGCPQQAYWRFFLNRALAETNINLHAGGAFAKAMEVARKNYYGGLCDAETAVGRGLLALIKFWGEYDPNPDFTPKTFDRVAGAYEFYWANYPLAFDKTTPIVGPNGPAVEFNFVLPIDIKHPQTGEPILYSGRFDMLGERQGQCFVVDEKTTKQLGEQWRNQWKLRSQFTGYCWGARKYGFDVAGFIIRGVSILKTKYDTCEAIGFRPQWHVDMWYEQLLRDIKRMVTCWEDNYWDKNLADTCSAYGGCPYTTLCESQTPQLWLKDYIESKWDPTRVF